VVALLKEEEGNSGMGDEANGRREGIFGTLL